MEAIIFLAIVVLIVGIAIVSQQLRRRRLQSMKIVEPGVEYPNNYHVLGVGYFHAASGVWYPHPWNEYREDRGYFWDGLWHRTPDQRMIAKSLPSIPEVNRVNQVWREADPEQARRFWSTVEHEGFGTAIRRSEGS